MLIVLLGIIWGCQSGEKTYNEGAMLYEQHCANCHMEDGTGLEELYPPLAKSDMLESLGASTACIIRNGLEGEIRVNGTVYNNKMLPIETLSAVEMTNIINYINNAWGNKRAFIELREVEKALEACAKD